MEVSAGVNRFVEVNGLKLHYLEWGDAGNPPLIMLHGVASLAHIFDYIAPAFQSDYRVMVLDWRGHGESDWAPGPFYSYDDYVGDLEGLIQVLGLENVTFVAHSLGGYVGLYCASRNTELVSAVVAADVRTSISPEEVEQLKQASQRPHKEINSREEIVGRFAASLAPTTASQEVLESIGRHAVKEVWPGKWAYRFDRRVMAIAEVSPWRFLPKVKTPTLIMRGEGSTMMTHEGARQMAQMVEGAGLVELKGAYHHLFLDKPEEFVGAVRSFLRREG